MPDQQQAAGAPDGQHDDEEPRSEREAAAGEVRAQPAASAIPGDDLLEKPFTEPTADGCETDVPTASPVDRVELLRGAAADIGQVHSDRCISNDGCDCFARMDALQEWADELQAAQRLPGRPRSVPQDVLDLISRLSATGLSTYAIARELDRLEIPTAHGAANWSRVTVQKLLKRA